MSPDYNPYEGFEKANAMLADIERRKRKTDRLIAKAVKGVFIIVISLGVAITVTEYFTGENDYERKTRTEAKGR